MAISPLNEVIAHLRRAVLPVRDEMTDGQLLGAFLKQRDDAALAALVQRHGPLVWGVCRRVLRDHQEVEDAFQATFLLLVRRAATIREREKVAHWLYRVAHQTALRARSMAARRSVRERQVKEMPEPAQAEQNPWSDLQPLLDQELSRLPEQYGLIIVLCDLEGKTRQEAARQLGCPEGTVASRLARGRSMLAKRMARHGPVVTGAAMAAMLSQHAVSASVPTSVMSSTIKAATLFAAGQSLVPDVISTNVAALTEGVLKSMLLTKLKMALAVLLVAVFGLGLLMHSALAQPQPGVEGDKVEKASPANADQDASLSKESKVRATFPGHTLSVWAVVYSPDGKTLATGSHDQTVKLWDVSTGKEQATLKGHSSGVRSLAFSPDGKTLASGIVGSPGATDRVKLWDVATGTELATLKGRGGCDGLGTVAFSPDGKTLATTEYKPIKLWDVTTNKERATLQGHTEVVSCVAFSPDGKTLASGSVDQTVKLWEVSSGKERATLQGHTEMVMSVAFSPDGKTLASASDDKIIKLWEVATGKERATFEGHSDAVLSVAFSPDGKTLASASGDKTVKLWEVPSGKERATLEGHSDAVRSVAFSLDGKTLASASDDKTVKLWDMPTPKKKELARVGGLTPADLDGLWSTLAGEDAVKAYQTIGTLVGATEQAVTLIKERLRPVSEPNAQQITSWINDLDSDEFGVREKAGLELEKLGKQAETALGKKLAEGPSVEVRQRIEQLLTRIEQFTPESLRAMRAVEVLEHIGRVEAKKVLETLATGAESARLTKEAKASLARLNKRVVTDK